MKRFGACLWIFLCLWLPYLASAQDKIPGSGWPKVNTWDTRSTMTWVRVSESGSEALVLGLRKVAKNGEQYLTEVLPGRKPTHAKQEVEQVKLLEHNGYQTHQLVSWQGCTLDVVTLYDPTQDLWQAEVRTLAQPAIPMRLTLALQPRYGAWPVADLKNTPNGLSYNRAGASISVSGSVPAQTEYNYPAGWGISYELNPSVPLSLSWGNLGARKAPLALAKTDVSVSMLHWHTIWDAVKGRPLTTVNRIWNVERGGYVVFCWDNFFNTWLWSKHDTAKAYQSLLNTLAEATPDGFVPNNSQGNGRASWDRSQPPVGSLVVRNSTLNTPKVWRVVYPALKKWNDWWWNHRRLANGMAWGSKQQSVPNKFNDAAWQNHLAAVLETGADDSPAYDGVLYDSTVGMLQMHDVALNALYAYDCRILAQVAQELGHSADAKVFTNRYNTVKKTVEGLWSTQAGIYLNKDLSTQTLNKTVTPFNLLALLVADVSEEQVKSISKQWLYNPQGLGGSYGLPSVMRSHPDFGKQRYWKGATWPPMNFLAWMAYRTAAENHKKKGNLATLLTKEAEYIATMSHNLFDAEYQRRGYVCENYSSISGQCDDGLVKSETFYLWGLLMKEMGR